MTICIRRIHTSEYEDASRLVVSVFRECVAASMEPEGVDVFEKHAEGESMRVRDTTGCTTYVAFNDESLVGVLHVKGGSHVSLLFVLPELQGQGIGRALIQLADRTSTLLTVHSSINATKSYESYGFRISAPEQISNGIRYVPMQRLGAQPIIPLGLAYKAAQGL